MQLEDVHLGFNYSSIILIRSCTSKPPEVLIDINTEFPKLSYAQ